MNEKQRNKILSCLDIANYFLVLVDRKAGDTITQLKLQKLIYFAQGISLALFDNSLFAEEIEAWKHGNMEQYHELYVQHLVILKLMAFIPTPREKDYLLSISQEDIVQIENAEDQWWMSYDSGVPAEDVTEQLLKAKKELQMIG